MRAAIAGVKRLGAARIVVAAGVAPLSTCLLLRPEVDDIVCVLTPRELRSVGLFYDHFPPLSDDDVCYLLEQARETGAPSAV
jgi:predicted phosphoribosyltransferase